MPKYTFQCQNCGLAMTKYTPRLVETINCDSCNGLSSRQLPILNGPADVTEVIDKHTGMTWRQDQKEQVKQRRDEYYWTVEVPRMVASGTYSVEKMLENGWIWIDDHNQIQVNNKPPSQR